MNVMRAAEQKRARAAGKPNGIEVAAIAPGDWQWLGPGNIGGRIRSIVIDPTNANKMWVGSVSGGIWYSANAGVSWGPVSDFMANLAVSSMVIDPTNSSIMYAGTGEGLWPLVEQVNFIDAVRGNGIFKSTDGGVTWNLLLQTNSADPLVCPGEAASPVPGLTSIVWRSLPTAASSWPPLSPAFIVPRMAARIGLYVQVLAGRFSILTSILPIVRRPLWPRQGESGTPLMGARLGRRQLFHRRRSNIQRNDYRARRSRLRTQ